MDREKLVEYIGGLELLAADRQATFFKIDVDIEVPPSVIRARDWYIVTITMKSKEPQPIGLFYKLFRDGFPHHLFLDQLDAEVFCCRLVCCSRALGKHPF